MPERGGGPERAVGFALSKAPICGYREAMIGRGASLVFRIVSLTGAGLLAGCTFALWDLPPSDRNTDSAEQIRDDEGSFLGGILLGEPADLPDAVPVPMRSAELERAYGGVIVRVTGVAPTQGYFNAALVAENGGVPDAAGVLTLSLVAVPPPTPEAVGPERTRLLLTAAFLQELELRTIRGFRVVAAQNVVTLPLR
jgi:hypothetical protein